jgi:membrane protease YdiL (CAAX protease family)
LTENKKRFRLLDHPWIVFLLFFVLVILSMALPGTILYKILGLPQDSGPIRFAQQIIGHALVILVFAPYILGMPKGRKPLGAYLGDIRLTEMRPLPRLVGLGISCYIILMLCQALGTVVYRLTEGTALTGGFLRSAFDLTRDLPPRSMSLAVSFPTIFEEVAFRGILLGYLLTRYSSRRAIAFSASGFGIIHALNLMSGRDPLWVMGQVAWAFVLGLFYGYLFVRTGSLLPNMIVHYLGNVFVGTFTHYVQDAASIEMQVLIGIIFTFGLLPTILMILWVRRVSLRRPFERQLA